MIISPGASSQQQPVWVAPQADTPLRATVPMPGSKSLTNRELVLSALADGPGMIRNPLESRDSRLMIDALTALGTTVDRESHDTFSGDDSKTAALRVTPADALRGSTSVHCGLAGTVMRFVPPIAALALGPVSFDGDPYARKRPMGGLVEGLRALGVAITDTTLPFTVHGAGSVAGGEIRVDASASSQFVSGLLLSAARFTHGLRVIHTGTHLPSLPHIEMTLETLRRRGVAAHSPEPGVWEVAPGPIAARDVTIEPDLSNAAPFLAAALVLGGTVSVPHWPSSTTQIGDELRNLLPAFGAEVTLQGGVLTVTGSGSIRGVDLHLPEAGELAPNLIGLAALADTPSRFSGIGHIRYHETDRIAALVENLTALGGNVREHDDGIEIHPAPLTGGPWKAFADHRIATTGALIGLRISGVEVDDIASTTKTLPDFPGMWQRMLQGGAGTAPGVLPDDDPTALPSGLW